MGGSWVFYDIFMVWNIENKASNKIQTWYPKTLIDKIKEECVNAQDNTGALIYRIIEEAEK